MRNKKHGAPWASPRYLLILLRSVLQSFGGIRPSPSVWGGIRRSHKPRIFSYAEVSAKADKKNGQAMVELLLVTPIFFTLILATFEFTSLFVQAQRVSGLSREVAGAIYRDCEHLSNIPGTPPDNKLDACVDDVILQVSASAGNFLPGFGTTRGNIIVGVYQYSPPDSAVYATNTGPASNTSWPTTNPGVRYSAQAAGSLFNPSEIGSIGIIQSQKIIITSEVFYTYQSVTKSSLVESFLPQRLYEATIY